MLELFFLFRLYPEMADLNETHQEPSGQEEMEREDVPNTNFLPNFYDSAMGKVVACERHARHLQRLYNFYIGKLRTVSLCMDSSQSPWTLHPRYGEVHPSNLLKAALTGLKLTRNTSRSLLCDIHSFGQIAWDQHKFICDMKDELDQVRGQLGEQQKMNEELKRDLAAAVKRVQEESLVLMHEQMQRLQDENKALADTLGQLQSSHSESNIELRQQIDQDGANATEASNQEADIQIYVLNENYTDGEVDLSESDVEELNNAEVVWDEVYTDAEVGLQSLILGKEE